MKRRGSGNMFHRSVIRDVTPAGGGGHKITFSGWRNFEIFAAVTEEHANDLINILFDGPDASFMISEGDDFGNVGSIETRGAHWHKRDGYDHFIRLSYRTIERHFKKGVTMGGNRPADELSVGVMSVLAHEIAHANQMKMHPTKDAKFWGRKSKYFGRPCEVAARRFADENEYIITSVLGLESEPRRHVDNSDEERAILFDLADVLSEIDTLCVEDLIQELKGAGINSPKYAEELACYIRMSGGNVIGA